LAGSLSGDSPEFIFRQLASFTQHFNVALGLADPLVKRWPIVDWQWLTGGQELGASLYLGLVLRKQALQIIDADFRILQLLVKAGEPIAKDPEPFEILEALDDRCLLFPRQGCGHVVSCSKK
jgi:hypothetical protein